MNLIVLDGHACYKSEVIIAIGGHTETQKHVHTQSMAVTVPSPKVSACDYLILL